MSDIKNETNEEQLSQQISLENIPKSITLTLVSVFLLVIFGAYQFLLPLLAELHYRDGYFDFFHKKYDKAIISLQLATDYAPWETHYRVQLGKAYEKASEVVQEKDLKIKLLNAAKTEYENILKIDGRNPWYLNRMAAIYQSFSNINTEKQTVYLDMAHKYIKQAALNDQNNPLFQMNLAYFYHKTGHPEKAETYYKKALAIDDRLLEGNFNYGELLLKQGRIDEALEKYRRVYAINPKFGKVAALLADFSIKTEDFEHTEDYLRTAIEKEPSNASALQNLVVVLFRKEKYSEVVTTFQLNKNIIGISNQGVFQIYIQSLLKIGKYDTAISEIEDYLTIYPNNKDIQNNLKMIKNAVAKSAK